MEYKNQVVELTEFNRQHWNMIYPDFLKANMMYCLKNFVNDASQDILRLFLQISEMVHFRILSLWQSS